MYGGAITPITKPGVLQSNLMKQELRMSAALRERESRMLTASGRFQIAMDYRAATLEGLDTTDRFLISAAAIPAREQLDQEQAHSHRRCSAAAAVPWYAHPALKLTCR